MSAESAPWRDIASCAGKGSAAVAAGWLPHTERIRQKA